MFKYVLFAALLAFASAKPKPLVVEYPVSAYEYATYDAPIAYSYSTHYDYHDHALPYTAYTYEYVPHSHYEYLRR